MALYYGTSPGSPITHLATYTTGGGGVTYTNVGPGQRLPPLSPPLRPVKSAPKSPNVAWLRGRVAEVTREAFADLR